MVKKLAWVLCIFLMVPFVTSCGESLKFWKKKKEVEVVNKKLPPFEELFNRTVEMYNSKQYKDAINSLLFLRENYPQKTAYQSRITLYLADSHFHQKEYPEAIANYEEFIKLYPTSPDVPYAYFQIGMSNYKQRRTYDRDATFVRKAIKSFKTVLDIAPPGVLVNESIRMIAFCQRELAMHELFVADFYLRTHHYKSAILRYEDVLHSYRDLKVHDRAHLGLGRAYLRLKDKGKAYRHLSYVARNYPSTPYGKEAWKLLQKKFKVASVAQLPVVTFPAKKETSREAKVAEKKKERKVSPKVIVEKPVRKAPAKPASEVVKKQALEPKPHVYFPKITKVREKPSVYFPPVKKVVEFPPTKRAFKTTSYPKVVKKLEKGKAATPKGAQKPTVRKRPKLKKGGNLPPNVKKIVKTDTLPPKGGKEPSSGLVGALDTRQPINITSDHVEAKQGKNSVRFYGSVVAKQKDVTLECNELTAFYTQGGKAIDKIVAHGSVAITQRNKKVECGKAVFYNAKRRIVLENAPVAWDGANRISGGKMILLLEKNEIQVLGSRKKPTELVIYPDKKSDLIKDSK